MRKNEVSLSCQHFGAEACLLSSTDLSVLSHRLIPLIMDQQTHHRPKLHFCSCTSFLFYSTFHPAWAFTIHICNIVSKQ